MTTLLERPPPAGAAAVAEVDNGGAPARRAMIRWAVRMFRREWRQQLLILALVIVAVAATFVGAAVAVDTQAPAHSGFGTAQDAATYQAPAPHLAADIARLQHRFGPVDVIDNESLTIPGSITTYDLRSQNPHGPFGGPMVSLVRGHYPTGPDQVALTSDLASTLHLGVGGLWHQGGQARRIVGIVQNPQSLLDEFALVAPGQVGTPTQVTVLFNAGGIDPASIGPNVESAASASASAGNVLNPDTIVLTLATLGMLLIALVAVGGFTVLAQRRLRAIGMLGALGATDKNIRLVVRANGLVVGLVGTVVGAAVGFAAWAAYRPHAEASSHHLIGLLALPLVVIIPAMILAVAATYFAAARPARSITKVPIVTALSGRPAAPKQVQRSAVPGVIVLVISFFLLAGASGDGGGPGPALPLGLIGLIVAIVLLSPLCLALLARCVGGAPVAVRLAVRDLARYRSRSGSALAAVSLGVLIAVLICVLSASRYGNVLDYAGPNMTSNQLIAYTPNSGVGGGPAQGGASVVPNSSVQSMGKSARALASALGTHDIIELDTTSESLQHLGGGRQFTGNIYVATPQLLAAFGIKASTVDRSADILTMRPGLASISNMQLTCSIYLNGNGGAGPGTSSCPKKSFVAEPSMEQVSALPSGTSAPNTVITEHAVHQLGLHPTVAGWLIQTAQPLTAAQINGARLTAAAAGLTIETKNDLPTSAEVTTWATVFGILLALGILAMSVGLIRSETAGDLRILAATGAGGGTRRTLTAATAGALALLGAVMGTVGAYVATIAYASKSANDSLSSLTNVPARNLLVIVIGMPLIAVAGGWLLAGREPADMAHQPLE